MIAPDDVNRRLNMTLSGPTVIDVVGGNPDIDLRLGYGDVNSRYANISGNNTPITKRGAGTLFISGTNTFTGDTTIEGGTLITYINTNNNQPLGEAANIVLRRNGSLEARGSNGQTMTMLDLSFRGGNILGYNAGSSTVKISLSSLSRVSRGTLVLKGTAGNAYWSSNGYLLVDAWKNNGALNVNGMLPPFFVHAGYATDQGLGTFAYLETSTGRVRLLAAASGGWSLGKYHKTTVAAASATETVDMTATAELQSDKEIWALRTTADLTSDDTTLTLGSGGIICNANVTIEPKIVFGNGSTEAFIYVAGAYGKSPIRTATFTDTLTTTTGLTKFGGGRLALTADNSATLLGTHFVNEGILSLADGSVLASDSVLNLEIGTALELGDDTTLKALHGSGSVSGNGTLTVSTVLSPGFAGDINTLKVGSLAMSGTLNWDYRENESDLVECQDLAFNGSILVNASWLGDNAPLAGSFPLFSYTGSNPTVSGWGVKAPTGMQGDVTLDQVNKKVMLNLYPGAAGTIIFIR
jgi:autotransporter-associated beta strand protein